MVKIGDRTVRHSGAAAVLAFMGKPVLAWSVDRGIMTAGILSDYHVRGTDGNNKELVEITYSISFHGFNHGPYKGTDIFPDIPAIRTALDRMTAVYDASRRMPKEELAGRIIDGSIFHPASVIP